MGFPEPPKRLCTNVRNKCFVFHGKELFWGTNPENSGGLQGTSNFTAEVIDNPVTLIANQNGTMLLLADSHNIQCLYPPFTKLRPIKTSQQMSPGRIKQIEWHPSTSHICILTCIQEFRVYRVDGNSEEPFKLEEKWSLLRFSGISSFCFGPPYQGPKFYTGWGRFAVFFVKDDGSILSLCPYTPKHTVVQKEVIEALQQTSRTGGPFLSCWKQIESKNGIQEMKDYRAYVPEHTPERQFQNLVIAPRQNGSLCLSSRVLDFSAFLPASESEVVLRYPIVFVLVYESGKVEMVAMFQPLQPYFQSGGAQSSEPVGVAIQRVTIPVVAVGPFPIIRQQNEDVFVVGTETVTQLTLPWLQEYLEIHNNPKFAKRMLEFVTPHTEVVNLSREGRRRVIQGFAILRSLSLMSGVSVVVACGDKIGGKLTFKRIRKSSFYQKGLLPSTGLYNQAGEATDDCEESQVLREAWLPENFEDAFALAQPREGENFELSTGAKGPAPAQTKWFAQNIRNRLAPIFGDFAEAKQTLSAMYDRIVEGQKSLSGFQDDLTASVTTLKRYNIELEDRREKIKVRGKALLERIANLCCQRNGPTARGGDERALYIYSCYLEDLEQQSSNLDKEVQEIASSEKQPATVSNISAVTPVYRRMFSDLQDQTVQMNELKKRLQRLSRGAGPSRIT